MTRTFDKSREIFAAAENLMPGGVNSPVRAFKAVEQEPIVMEKGHGAIITDVDGNDYIDYVLSWGPLIIGHTHPDVVSAIQRVATTGTSFGASTQIENELAKEVIKRVPSVEMIRMVSSGTEATMSAIRAARGFTGRDKILKFEGSYHGHGDSLLIKAGSGVATLGLPDSPGVPMSIAQNTLTVPYNNLEAVLQVFEKYGEEIAAVIVEPVAGNMGCVPPLPGFLEGLRDVTTKAGTILIFDEVMTGFRVGYHSAQGYYGVTPDLTCLGKVIGGGLPVGAFGGRRDIMEKIAPAGPIYQAGTLSGNPLAMTAGLETIQHLTEDSYKHFEKLGDRLEAGFREAAETYNIPHTVNRAGSMIGYFLTNEKVIDFDTAKTSDLQLFAEYYGLMAQQGVFLPPSQFEGVFVSTAHTEEHIDHTIKAFQNAFKQLKR